MRPQVDGSSHDQDLSRDSLAGGGLRFSFENGWAVAHIAALVTDFYVLCTIVILCARSGIPCQCPKNAQL